MNVATAIINERPESSLIHGDKQASLDVFSSPTNNTAAQNHLVLATYSCSKVT